MSTTNKFIDFDKSNELFYDNLYLNDEKIVIKIPIHVNNGKNGADVKMDKFDLSKYTYLVSYE
ncbi:MAG: hypothetical protein GF317_03635 [Candidatus Lokiarchaeota archaeon]|nr:hypothetical protein [Candidatus Lokiarchaeota archaeon]MBD3198979.1 hypothetical protein [Candidatus Lokiarchaeota archaeon]